MGATYRTKYTENIYDRNWGKNNAMFISNMVRASIFNEFELVKQGFAPTAAFDNAVPQALVGLSFEGKEYFCLKSIHGIQVKYKAKQATKEIATYLKRKGLMNKFNYKNYRTKVFILWEQNTGSNFIEVFENGAVNFLNNPSEKQSNSKLYTYDYYESVLHNNIVHCFAEMH